MNSVSLGRVNTFETLCQCRLGRLDVDSFTLSSVFLGGFFKFEEASLIQKTGCRICLFFLARVRRTQQPVLLFKEWLLATFIPWVVHGLSPKSLICKNHLNGHTISYSVKTVKTHMSVEVIFRLK